MPLRERKLGDVQPAPLSCIRSLEAKLDSSIRGRKWPNGPGGVLRGDEHQLDGMLPGAPTIPEQIAANKGPYYDALEKADSALEEHGRVDVSELESMLSNMLAKQLMSIAVLSETSADRLARGPILGSRGHRAEKLERMFGTVDLEGRLWPMSLDQVAFQVAAPSEVRAAEHRLDLAEHQSPFPGLLASPEDEGPSRSISKEEEGISCFGTQSLICPRVLRFA